jgi:hypothetical protein
MAKFMGIELEILDEKLEEVFGKKGEIVVNLNKAIVKNIYNTFEIKPPLTPPSKGGELENNSIPLLTKEGLGVVSSPKEINY